MTADLVLTLNIFFTSDKDVSDCKEVLIKGKEVLIKVKKFSGNNYYCIFTSIIQKYI